MTKQEFIYLVGECPEDVLGPDWANTIEEWEEEDVPTYMREEGEIKDEHARQDAEETLERDAEELLKKIYGKRGAEDIINN